jgi:regulator of extracellular matrix RemA (YlzA/DUF370 family)
MAYMVPLNFIEISKKPRVAVCATRIVAILSTDMYQARRTIHDEKKAGSLINACGTNAAKSAIIMDNGAVASSPFTVSILMNKIEKANEAIKNSSKLKTLAEFNSETTPDKRRKFVQLQLPPDFWFYLE